MNRKKRAEIAQQTLDILECGQYQNSKGEKVFLGDALKNAIENTQLYRPDDFASLIKRSQLLIQKNKKNKTQFVVRNVTSLQASRDLLHEGAKKVFCLNFASAKNPGGGFLSGSQAQEESLARATGMYPCLLTKQEMYDANKSYRSCIYTSHMIFSPDVPVFRDDDDNLLDEYYTIGILTAPAVNRGAIEKNEHNKISKIESAMLTRIERLLAIAVVEKYEYLVLGAWGCGVFRNHPKDIAAYFAHHLLTGTYQNAFTKIVFAVLSRNDSKFSAFTKTFSD